MYILVHNDEAIQEVLYDDYNDTVKYLLDIDKKSDTLCPWYKGVRDVEYNIRERSLSESMVEFSLIRSDKLYSKGYFYSSLAKK